MSPRGQQVPSGERSFAALSKHLDNCSIDRLVNTSLAELGLEFNHTGSLFANEVGTVGAYMLKAVDLLVKGVLSKAQHEAISERINRLLENVGGEYRGQKLLTWSKLVILGNFEKYKNNGPYRNASCKWSLFLPKGDSLKALHRLGIHTLGDSQPLGRWVRELSPQCFDDVLTVYRKLGRQVRSKEEILRELEKNPTCVAIY